MYYINSIETKLTGVNEMNIFWSMAIGAIAGPSAGLITNSPEIAFFVGFFTTMFLIAYTN